MAKFISTFSDDELIQRYLYECVDEDTGEIYYCEDWHGKGARIASSGVALQIAKRRNAEYIAELERLADDVQYRKSVKEALYREIASELKDNGPRGFAGIVGMQALKDQLEEEVLFPLKNKSLMMEYKIHPSNGMLLYGPPGCGKTFFALKFAEESGMMIKFVRASSVGSKYSHNTARKIQEMFDDAKKMAPCVICIDEIDAICPSRTAKSEEGERDLNESVDEFLSQMNNCSKDGIFVIGTTNNPFAIDTALLRTGRMDNLVYVPLPDEDSRRAMLIHYMKGRPQEENIDYDTIAKLTDGMNCSDIEAMVNTVALRAARKHEPITYQALSVQAKTQRRSVYIPKDDDEQPEGVATVKKQIIGFANYQIKKA